MKSILIIILSVFLIQCSSVNQAPEPMRLPLKEILRDPDKLLNIKQNFPNIIVDSLLFDKMRDKTYINELVSFINTELHGEDSEDLFQYDPAINPEHYLHPSFSNNYKKVFNYNISVQYCSNIKKTGSLQLFWIYTEGRYILFFIKYGYRYSSIRNED